MSILRTFLLTSLMLSTFAVANLADDGERPAHPAAVEAPSTSFGLGIAFIGRPYAEMDDDLQAMPLGQWERGGFFLRGPELGWGTSVGGPFSVDFFVTSTFEELDPDESPVLSGMEKRKMTAEGGLRLSYRRGMFTASVSFQTDLLGEHEGQRAELELARGFMLGSWMVEPTVGFTWVGEDIVDYYYGVRADEARDGRPAYLGDSTVNFWAGVTVARPVTERWSFFAAASYQSFGDEIKDSPIIDENGTSHAVVGLLYNF